MTIGSVVGVQEPGAGVGAGVGAAVGAVVGPSVGAGVTPPGTTGTSGQLLSHVAGQFCLAAKNSLHRRDLFSATQEQSFPSLLSSKNSGSSSQAVEGADVGAGASAVGSGTSGQLSHVAGQPCLAAFFPQRSDIFLATQEQSFPSLLLSKNSGSSSQAAEGVVDVGAGASAVGSGTSGQLSHVAGQPCLAAFFLQRSEIFLATQEQSFPSLLLSKNSGSSSQAAEGADVGAGASAVGSGTSGQLSHVAGQPCLAAFFLQRSEIFLATQEQSFPSLLLSKNSGSSSQAAEGVVDVGAGASSVGSGTSGQLSHVAGQPCLAAFFPQRSEIFSATQEQSFPSLLLSKNSGSSSQAAEGVVDVGAGASVGSGTSGQLSHVAGQPCLAAFFPQRSEIFSATQEQSFPSLLLSKNFGSSSQAASTTAAPDAVNKRRAERHSTNIFTNAPWRPMVQSRWHCGDP